MVRPVGQSCDLRIRLLAVPKAFKRDQVWTSMSLYLCCFIHGNIYSWWLDVGTTRQQRHFAVGEQQRISGIYGQRISGISAVSLPKSLSMECFYWQSLGQDLSV